MAVTITTRSRSQACEAQLVAAAKRGGPRERERLVEHYEPLIATVARIYRGAPGIERRELMQEGVVGLLRALDGYDLERGIAFWPYASWWVRRSMQRLVAQLAHPIVLSDRALRELARIRQARDRYAQRDGHDPTSEELALEVGIPTERLRSLLAAHVAAYGLDESLTGGRDQGTTIAELVADPSAEEGYEAVVLRVATAGLPGLLGHLDERECRIVAARYGVDGEPRELREIGTELALTAERVRQIHRIALAKLQAAAGALEPAVVAR
ncbi:MAG TPA: sigma-70 family RNA polymerase sigma factor [Solirubrobacteraceae bacterium]|nr:sigma-70 family RNA polymerase sigma factor [Solirubrobacteraceae bacterium]